ncbi:MAG: terminase TerL endonuclease subunit [Parasphingorhabdus sp.]|uniref:terminase large subunit n=1 Tax=Parasphingorhabdus sp. TaxID=2709688 RepID=UPI003296915C
MARKQTTRSRTKAAAPDSEYVRIAIDYAKAAVKDRWRKDHCELVRLTAKRFLNDLKKARQKKCSYYFSEWHADDVCGFIELLPHVQGSWDDPAITLEPAQIFILVNVFGFRRKSDDRRRFTRAYIEVARKNGKSTFTAGVALYCLTCEGELGPEIIVGATTGAQADKVFKPAKLMVDRTSPLREAFGLKAWARSITCADNGGTVQPINSNSSTQDGWNPYVGILDELHAHKDRGLFDVIRSAFGARKQPLMWMITTAGYDVRGVCYEQRTLLEKILKGTVEADHYFGIVFTMDEGDDPFDERTWGKANPLLGAAVDPAELRGYAIEAKASPASLGEFLTKRLNVWLNAASAWLSVDQWNKAEISDLDWSDFQGLECTIGADLADKDDITALTLIGQYEDEKIIIKPIFFIPSAALLRETQSDTGQSTYGVWAGHNGGPALEDEVEGLPDLFDENDKPLAELSTEWRGHLVVTPGDFVDHNSVEMFVRWLVATQSVRKITFDQFAAAQQMAVNLNEDLGTPDDPIAVVLHKSAANVTNPAKELEARVRAKDPSVHIGHDGNPVLTWMVSNAVVTRHINGTIIPKKESKDSANKIDGVDAMINAIAPLVAVEEEDGHADVEHTGL